MPMIRAALLSLLLASPTLAHMAYPWQCCSGKDCQPVSCDSIVETPNGFDWDGLHYKREQVQLSRDQECHACAGRFSVNGAPGRTPRCLFIVPTT